MTDYSARAQAIYCEDKDNCYFGKHITLAEIKREFGNGAPTAWLIPHLTELSVFAGCKDKLTKEQIRECAILIAQEYFYLKVTELMLFFRNFKLGKYGKFYGAVDPLVIMSALRDFMEERNEAYFKHEGEVSRQKEKLAMKNAISYEEHLRRHELKKQSSLTNKKDNNGD